MPGGDYTLRDVNDCLVIGIEAGNLLNVNEVSRIGTDLTRALKSETRNVVLDLSKVRYAGSAALGLFVSISKLLKENGSKLVLAGTQQLEALFKASRTLAIFEMAPDVDAAVAAIKK
jgi:anti-anti-sigma factor